jgi:hypothetical protein
MLTTSNAGAGKANSNGRRQNISHEESYGEMLSIPDIPPDTDCLTAALLYAAAGFYVLPVRKGSKNPGSIVGTKWQDKSSRDSRVIAAWFAATDHDIALHCGRSGVLVFDVDYPDNVPEVLRPHFQGSAPYQSTRPDTRGRGHHMFRMPSGLNLGNSTGRLKGGWGQVRGTNGVIMVEPSLNPDGRYHWERVGLVPELPQELADLLPKSSKAQAASGNGSAPDSDTDAATDDEVSQFFSDHRGGSSPGLITAVVKKLKKQIKEGESRHESALSAMTWAMEEAAAGLYPAAGAADAIRDVFIKSLAQPRNSSERVVEGDLAESEWSEILAWAVGRAQSKTEEELEAIRKKAPTINGSARPKPESVRPVSLTDALATFQDWLPMDDTAPVLVVAAAVVANLTEGDPVWLLIVGPPSGGKTEILSSCSSLPYIVPTATITEAALLSGTSKRERAADATGGLMRQIGEFGILLAKDFTSVLAQNRDTAKQAIAAMREIYDGKWDRPVGTDGGRVLHWEGKCGFIGGVTPSYDRYGSIVNTLGDRYLLLRLPNVDATKQARAALAQAEHEKQMRAELGMAMTGLIASTPCLAVERG